jgi:CMP-N-acetylneuraminic acid synthetase
MYTEAVTKVFRVHDQTLDLHGAKVTARQAGYDALSFNGDIYIRSEKKWHKTPFVIQDFVVGFNL